MRGPLSAMHPSDSDDVAQPMVLTRGRNCGCATMSSRLRWAIGFVLFKAGMLVGVIAIVLSRKCVKECDVMLQGVQGQLAAQQCQDTAGAPLTLMHMRVEVAHAVAAGAMAGPRLLRSALQQLYICCNPPHSPYTALSGHGEPLSERCHGTRELSPCTDASALRHAFAALAASLPGLCSARAHVCRNHSVHLASCH